MLSDVQHHVGALACLLTANAGHAGTPFSIEAADGQSCSMHKTLVPSRIGICPGDMPVHSET